MPKQPLVVLVCAALLAGPLVAGCSGGTAQQRQSATSPASVSGGSAAAPAPSGSGAISSSVVFAGAQGSVERASSVHIVGTRLDSQGRMVNFERTGTMDGSNMDAITRYADVEYEVLAVGGAGYVKGNSGYWEQEGKLSSDEVNRIGGKWVKVNHSLSSQIQQMSPGATIDDVFAALSAADFESSATSTTANGEAAYELDNGDRKSMLVQASSWLPIRLSSETGSLSLDQWNSAPAQRAPAADQVIDISSV